jgi:hypothetical protein
VISQDDVISISKVGDGHIVVVILVDGLKYWICSCSPDIYALS